jgi:hypothetical protein
MIGALVASTSQYGSAARMIEDRILEQLLEEITLAESAMAVLREAFLRTPR